MSKLRLGQVDYVNCLPVYTAIEEGIVPLEAQIIKGHPTELNNKFLAGELDITPISSIEYARNADQCIILPDLSISADGQVMSILLFSKVPVTELEGKTVCLPSSSATSVVLLKILLEHYYQVGVNYVTTKPELDAMLAVGDAALLIGDDAMRADVKLRYKKQNSGLFVYDLGVAWKEFTGEAMVYAVWVIHRDFASGNAKQVGEVVDALHASRNWGLENVNHLLEVGHQRSPQFSLEYLVEYFGTIKHRLDESYRRALNCYFDYAYKSGLIPERVKLSIWGETSENSQYTGKSDAGKTAKP